MTRTALVAGAAGFLSSHLVDRLLHDGWEVEGIDNFSSGRPSNLQQARINGRFRMLKADLSEKVALPPADVVFSMASEASPPRYQQDPIGTLKVNCLGTNQLLEHAHHHGARFVLASTSEVYGDPAVHPQTEVYWGNVNPVGPRSCYDEGKRFAEALTMAWHRSKGVDVRIARIFNTYGPRMGLDDGRIVSTFFRQGLRGEPITVQGDGQQTRSFCYVDDLVDGLVRLAEVGEVDGPVNLGNPSTEHTVLQVANKIQALTGGRSAVKLTDRPTDDPGRRRPDIAKAKAVLGWEPKVTLHDGLARCVPYFEREVRLAHGVELRAGNRIELSRVNSGD